MNLTNTSPSNLLYRVFKNANIRRRKQFFLVFIIMVLTSIFEVISISTVFPFLAALTEPEYVFNHPRLQIFIQSLGLTNPKELILPLTIIFAVGAIISGLMRLVLLFILIRFSHALGADLSINIYQRTLFQPYSIHVARNSSEIIAAITEKTNTVVYYSIMPTLHILSGFLMLVSILLMLFLVNPVIAAATFFGFGSIYLLILTYSKKILIRNSLKLNKMLDGVYKALQEGLGGIRDIIIGGTQNIFISKYRNVDLPLRRAKANIEIISNSPRFIIEALGMVIIAIIAYVFSQDFDNVNQIIPILGLIAFAAQRLLPILQKMYSSYSAVRGGLASIESTLILLEQPLPDNTKLNSSRLMDFKKNITLKNIVFRYTPSSPLVLKNNINLNIKKGSHIGLIGITGSGKSTLIDILMGLIIPSSGSLLIDGVEVSEKNNTEWFNHIAHVPQSIFLSDASIAENIAFGIQKKDIDYKRLKIAVTGADLLKTIESWDEGYNTVVGERGARLSGGQRQRIGIARALYKKSDVIILDEATSSLDNETEADVMKFIEGLGKEITLIIVAHRLTTLKNCSKIIEIRDGQISGIKKYKDIIN
ncbi:ABC transporter ATP-binding protein/permease [Amylibacter sp.]|nr:ABC transporter ATP-binding protein/permease [Amylibacter sp.]